MTALRADHYHKSQQNMAELKLLREYCERLLGNILISSN